jgi:hypothetical protein
VIKYWRKKTPKSLLQIQKSGSKGDGVKIDRADRTPRETLEERLEETPSNARCFAQGSFLMC